MRIHNLICSLKSRGNFMHRLWLSQTIIVPRSFVHTLSADLFQRDCRQNDRCLQCVALRINIINLIKDASPWHVRVFWYAKSWMKSIGERLKAVEPMEGK